MRIGFLSPEFVSETKFDGGLANYLFRTTKILLEMGHEPEVFVLTDKSESIKYEGITVHRIKMPGQSNWMLPHCITNRFKFLDFSFPSIKWGGARVLAQHVLAQHFATPFDIVQATDFGCTGMFLTKKTRPFPMATRLSWYYPEYRRAAGAKTSLATKLVDLMERRSMANADICYAPSHNVAQIASRETKLDIKVIPPPVPAELPKLIDDEVYRKHLNDKTYVLFFGRICPLKGVHQLVRSMKGLLAGSDDLNLVLVGREEGTTLQELKALLGDLSHRLIHIGRQNHVSLRPIIQNAKCVVLPSRFDNFPNTCVEAILDNQIVIGTKEGSFAEIIEDKISGFVVSRDSVEGLQQAIATALNLTPDQRCRMTARARESVGRFAPGTTIGSLLNLYSDAVISFNKMKS